MKKFKIIKIVYDGDESDIVDLPLDLIYETESNDIEDIEQEISDYISNETGFCHKGFDYFEIE